MNPVELLGAASGNWSGTNTLQNPMTGNAEESPSTAAVTPILGGRFVRVDYTWECQGEPQQGSLTIGFEPKLGEVSGHWIDSWHMGRLAMNCRGPATGDGTIALRGSFAVPPGPDWGWRIEIVAGDELRIIHTNIHPDGEEDRAVEGVYSRS